MFSANCLLVVCPKQSIFSLILCLKPHPSPYSTWNMKYIRNTLFVMGVEYTAFLAGDVCMCVTVCLPWFIFFQICALHDIPSKHSISVKTLRKKKKKKGILVYFDATGFLFSILVLEMHCCVFPEHAFLHFLHLYYSEAAVLLSNM